jgi:multidrug efflux system outer membrane protein
LPTQNHWPKEYPDFKHGVIPSKTHWRSFFVDPQLQTLIVAGIEKNRDLRIAAARVEEARAQFNISKADFFPTLNAVASGSTAGTTSDISGAGAQLNTTRYDINLTSVSFEVDLWGRLSKLNSAARNNYLASQEARRTVHLSLVSEIARGYFTLLQLQEAAALTRSSIELREESLAIVSKGVEIGGTYEYELQLVTGILESTKAALYNIEQQIDLTSNQLNYLVGNSIEQKTFGATFSGQALDMTPLVNIPSETLLARPDVIAAEQRLLAAHANIDAARAAFLPKILLTASMGLAGPGLASLFSAGTWAFQPLISMPLFDAGRTAGGLDLANARKEVAVAEYEKTLQIAFREVADQLTIRAALARQFDAANAYSTSQKKRLDITRARYSAGLVPYLEVLDMQREHISARQAVSQVRRAQLEVTTQLYKALGGGYQGTGLESENPVSTETRLSGR